MTADFRRSLPFAQAAPHFLADAQLRANLRRATSTIREKRQRVISELADFEELRQAAAGIKDDALSRLDVLLEQVEQTVTAAGGHVHFARDGEEANRLVVGLVAARGASEVVKVKSMTSAETRLNEALEQAGIEAAETDLAELIIQLGEDLPSHIVVPAIHRNRSEVRDIFNRHMGERGLGAPPGMTDAPAELAGAARAHLRQRFLRATVGISGANFVIAESGSVVVVESEGNGRMCVTLPETLVTIAGIDKVLPRFSDLEVFLQLLARSATGERMNPYTSIWSGVVPGDGPREFHLVLVDNGRTSALADKVGRQALRCIHCAACLNVCPVYERVGGHAYGSVYPGPIGAVLTPQLHGVATDKVTASLPFASTLCGACYEVCPVGIDIPRLLVHLRARSVEEAQAHGPSLESLTMAAAGAVLSSPRRMARAERWAGRMASVIFPRGKIGPLPGPLRRWTAARDAPLPARQSFRDWWAQERAPSPGTPAPSRSLPGPAPGRRRPKGPGPVGPGHRHGRDAVLEAVKGALRAAPFHPPAPTRSYRGAGRSGVQDSLGLFIDRVSEYRAEVHVVAHEADVPGAVAGALARRASKRVVVPADLPGNWLPHDGETSPVPDTGELGPHDLDGFDAAVTGCAVAIASTGTIVLDGGMGQGRRAVSLVPDHLVVVVKATQLVGGVPDAIAKLDPSAPQTWVSGPSATSDIELARVEGVHGPRRLDVVVVTG